jgi:uncharacterized protein YndB with AHSA1/START domain
MLTKITATLVLLVVGLCLVIQMQPGEFKVSRKLKIHAAAGVVYEQLTDFHKWEQWSPWANHEPETITTYSGPAAGVGASYQWVADDEESKGNMEIKAVKPAERVDIQMELQKPFGADCHFLFTLQPEGEGVLVNWEMTGHYYFWGKVWAMLVSVDQSFGKAMERGLGQLKALSEKKAEP